MGQISQITSNKLSHFRTQHTFEYYAEFDSVQAYLDVLSWARERGLPVYILGNGSNTFFCRSSIHTVVLRNRLPKTVRVLDTSGGHQIEASSSVMVSALLQYCRSNHLDSFYYLASVPATVGGALAMNAGRGRRHSLTIFDFVETVTYVDGATVHTVGMRELDLEYRHTMFTGVQDKLIISAVFRFPEKNLEDDEIKARIEYSKARQDHSAPNCGSVFKEYWGPAMRILRGIRLGPSWYSRKTTNWLLTRAKHPRSIRALIVLAKLVHRLFRRRAVLELIEVD